MSRPRPTRERVIKLLLAGATNAEMAKTIGISVRTIKQHMFHLMTTHRADNRVQLIRKLSGTTVPEGRIPQLTPRESEAARYSSLGFKNAEVAVLMGTTEQVIKNYMRRVYDALGVWNRLELAVMLGVPNVPESEIRGQRECDGEANGAERAAEQEAAGSNETVSVLAMHAGDAAEASEGEVNRMASGA